MVKMVLIFVVSSPNLDISLPHRTVSLSDVAPFGYDPSSRHNVQCIQVQPEMSNVVHFNFGPRLIS